jgi:hypothetical protein
LNEHLADIVQARAIIPQDFALSFFAQAVDLQELIDGVRKVRVDVRVIGGHDEIVIAEPFRHVGN